MATIDNRSNKTLSGKVKKTHVQDIEGVNNELKSYEV